jgi:hypothetical protein
MSPTRKLPRFSICLPVWQGADMVHVAIESVLAQTLTAWELIVGDNASIDEIESVVARYRDPRIKLRRWSRHLGAYENLNRTIALGRAEWLVPIGADDRLHADALEQMWNQIVTAGKAGIHQLAMVVTPSGWVDAEGRSAAAAYYGSLPPKRVAPGIYDASAWLAIVAAPGNLPWNLGSIAFSRSAIAESGSTFRPDVGPSADDELVARLASFGAVAYSDSPLVDCAVHVDAEGNRRYAFGRWGGEKATPLGAALVSALAAHVAEREVSSDERRSVVAAVARTHLQRARHHRLLRGGEGRRGALRDVLRAVRRHPGTLLSWWGITVAFSSLLAPRRAIVRSSLRWTKTTTDADADEQGKSGPPQEIASEGDQSSWPKLPETVAGDMAVLVIAIVLLVGLLVVAGR